MMGSKMGYLQHTKCYLVGGIEHDKNLGRDWRLVVSDHLSYLGVQIYNPLNRPKWMKSIEPFIPPAMSRADALASIEQGSEDADKIDLAQKFVRQVCLRYVHSCDFVFCYLPDSKTYGTTEEIVIAANAKKPIIFVFPDKIPSLWVYDLARNQDAFSDLKGALHYLDQVNQGEVPLDVFKWIFLSQDYPLLKLEDQYDW
jgi:hypothetical protein